MSKSWQVLIEWDGQKPSSTWYRRLERIAGAKVRGDKTLSPLARRENTVEGQNRGLVFQEGAIIVPSESLARTLAAYALNGFPSTIKTEEGDEFETIIRAKAVQVAKIEYTEIAELTDEDRRALDRINSVLGRRGRPIPASAWVVTCLEEGRVFQVNAPHAIACPECGATYIRARLGILPELKDDRGDVVATWIRTRFSSGEFLPLDLKDRGQEAPEDVTLQDADEFALLKKIEGASDLLDFVRTCDRDVAFRVLDFIFMSRRDFSEDRRKDARILAMTEFFKIGGSPIDFPLFDPDLPDVFSSAIGFRPEDLAALAIAHQKGKGS